jgi:hypothetical protein
VNLVPWGLNSLLAPPFFSTVECSPLGLNEGVNIPPRRQISLLGVKFTPRGENHTWGPRVKLRMVLCFPADKTVSMKHSTNIKLHEGTRPNYSEFLIQISAFLRFVLAIQIIRKRNFRVFCQKKNLHLKIRYSSNDPD